MGWTGPWVKEWMGKWVDGCCDVCISLPGVDGLRVGDLGRPKE